MNIININKKETPNRISTVASLMIYTNEILDIRLMIVRLFAIYA